MRTLDRYIIRQFLVNTAILTVVLLGLFVLVDLIIDVDEFIQAGQHYADQRPDSSRGLMLTTGFLRGMARYYAPFLVLLFIYFCGLLVAAGMGFTLASLARSRELVAMLTGGISMYRIAAPIVVVGFALCALALPLQEYVLPRLADALARGKSQIKYVQPRGVAINYAADRRPDGARVLLSAATFRNQPGHATLTGVTLLETHPDGRVVHVTAQEAWWDARQQAWQLTQGYAVTRAPHATATPEPFSPRMTAEPTQIELYPSRISPDVLMARRASLFLRLLSLEELVSLLHNTAADQYRVQQVLWSRFSALVVNVLILVMTMTLFLTREPVNVLLQAAAAAGLAIGAWAAALLVLQVSEGALNPVASAWLPVVLYLPLSAVLLARVKT